jgi:hypothetical protein
MILRMSVVNDGVALELGVQFVYHILWIGKAILYNITLRTMSTAAGLEFGQRCEKEFQGAVVLSSVKCAAKRPWKGCPGQFLGRCAGIVSKLRDAALAPRGDFSCLLESTR